MHSHLHGNLGSSEPAAVAKVFDIGRNTVGVANVPDDQPRKRVVPASAETTGVESLCNLSVRLFGRQRADKFDDSGWSTNQIRRAQRQWPFY